MPQRWGNILPRDQLVKAWGLLEALHNRKVLSKIS